GDENFSETLAVYDGRTLAAVILDVPSDAEPGEYVIRGSVGYQPCDDATCEAPTSRTFEATVSVLSEGEQPSSTPDSEVVALFEKTLARKDELPPESEADQVPPVDATDSAPFPTDEAGDTAEQSGRPTFFGLSLPRAEGVLGWLLLALFSALGGFLLNLTPCVLPVIPLKVMAIQKHASKPSENLVLGLWMALGVTAFWVVVGLPVAFVAGVADPSRLFGIWWLTLSIGLLIGFMGIGIMGMFTIQLPNS